MSKTSEEKPKGYDFEPYGISSPTGATLAVRRKSARGNHAANPKAIIQIAHGMGEHAGRYWRFAEALSAAGYATIAYDHRGHGETIAPDAAEGKFSHKQGLEKVLADMVFVNGLAREAVGSAPVVLFGHSMGSILSLNYCVRHSDTIDAAALWNSGVDGGLLLTVYEFLLKAERALKGSDVPSKVAWKLTFEDWNKRFAPNRTDFDWLSRDEHEVDKYVADPFCGIPITIGLWLEVVKGIRTGASDKALANIRTELPMHLLAGGADPCSRNGAAVEKLAIRLRNIGMDDLTFTLLPDTRHESLNEINREATTADFISWLDGRFASRIG